MAGPTDIDRNHVAFQELLGAYALGAVPPEEAEALASHLAACPACRAELAALRAAVHALPLTVEEQEPPPVLRYRLQAALDRELAGGNTGWTHAQLAPPPPPRPRPPARPRRPFPVAWAAAALLLVLALGLFGWNLQLQDSLREAEEIQTVAIQAEDPETGARGELAYLEDREVLVLTLRDLPPIPPERVYQVWLVGEEEPIPAGVLRRGETRVAVAAKPAQYEALAVTVEPGPLGSPAPTADPVVVVPLRLA